MNRHTIAILCLTVGLASGDAFGQAKVTRDQLVGTWKYTSVVVQRTDGSRVEPFGPNPGGWLILAPGGRFSVTLLRSDLPKIGSKDRLTTTPQETEAVAHGVLAYFGTYSVNEADSTLNLHVDASSFANDNGTDQKRVITSFTGDELKWTNNTPTTPTTAYAVLKRIR